MFTISEIEHYASMESFIGSYVTYTKHVAAPLLPGYSLVIYTSGRVEIQTLCGRPGDVAVISDGSETDVAAWEENFHTKCDFYRKMLVP